MFTSFVVLLSENNDTARIIRNTLKRLGNSESEIGQKTAASNSRREFKKSKYEPIAQAL